MKVRVWSVTIGDNWGFDTSVFGSRAEAEALLRSEFDDGSALAELSGDALLDKLRDWDLSVELGAHDVTVTAVGEASER